MKWHVIYDSQPKIEIQNVYAYGPISAAEIIAEIHGVIGLFQVKDQEKPSGWLKVIISRSWKYEGRVGGPLEQMKFGR